MSDTPLGGPGPLDDPESSDAETPDHFDLTPRTAAAPSARAAAPAKTSSPGGPK